VSINAAIETTGGLHIVDSLRNNKNRTNQTTKQQNNKTKNKKQKTKNKKQKTKNNNNKIRDMKRGDRLLRR
jgi:hypothetical protein